MKNFTISTFALICMAAAAIVANDAREPQGRVRRTALVTAPTPAGCPKVWVSSPAKVKSGADITFSAKVTGVDPSLKLVYRWTLSNGEISTGQNTAIIKVKSNRLGGETVTGSVDVFGFDDACPSFGSSETYVDSSERE